MTKSQLRDKESRQYNAYLAECPGHALLAMLSDKWVTLVVSALAEGPQRYSQLSTTIAGVSQKMLTQTLRKLERDGLLSRKVTPTVPVRVDYQLTALGQSLLPVQRAIKDWAESHIEQVQAARADYETDHPHRPSQ